MASKSKAKKVVIEYPPVPLRKWKPPHKPHHADPQNRKEMSRKPEFPHSEKLHPSTLDKVWHKYKMISKRCAVLYGSHAQSDLKFPIKVRGKQGPANCFAAIGFFKCKEMQNWEEKSLNLILDIGNKLYHQSVRLNKSTCTCASPKEVHNTFYIGATNIVLGIDNDIVKGTIYKVGDAPCLMDTMVSFFANPGQCCLEIDGKYMAIWKAHGSYYLFDPNDREEDGLRCRAGTGKAMVFKFLDLPEMVNNLWDNSGVPNTNYGFTMTPIHIRKFGMTNLAAPKDLKEIKADKPAKVTTGKEKPKSCLATKVPPKSAPSNVPMSGARPGTIKALGAKGSQTKVPAKARSSVDKKGTIERKTIVSVSKSNTPSLTSVTNSEKVEANKALVPLEKPKITSLTYFHVLSPDKCGIIRSTYAQDDAQFSKYYGQQSLANALTALAMLREYKSKLWFTKILDEVLISGESYYRNCRKNLVGDIPLGIYTIDKILQLNNNSYTPEIEECTILGKLNSNKYNVLDLLPALEEFFTDNDTGLIRGPLLLAVWSEEGKFYMFDPNKRDKTGKIIQRDIPGGDEDDKEQGYACVTWFISLADLVNLYMLNVKKTLRREHFYISKVEIKDYYPKVLPWNNFTGLRFGKLILRGTISQNNIKFTGASRNTQCTAIAVMALVYKQLKSPELWNRETIDEIVTEGDTFYMECVKILKAKNKFINKMLMVAEMPDRYKLKENELNLDIEDCLINGVLTGPDNDDVPNLKQGFLEFFKDNDTCIVTSRGLSVAIWKTEDVYFYFDSHSRDECGYRSNGGTACVLRLYDIDDLTRILKANLGAGSTDLYNISRVDVTILETTDGIVKPKFNNFTELSAKKGILRAASHQGDKELFDIHANKQTIPNLLVSLGMSSVYPTNLWERGTLNQVLEIGNQLYVQSREDNIKKDLANVDNWETETEAKNVDLVDMDSVICEFKIGVNKINVNFADTKEGVFEEEEPKIDEEGNEIPPEKSLRKDLTSIFVDENDADARKQALLDSSQLSIAIWKEMGLYYLFDPMSKDEEGNCYGRDAWSEKIVVEEEEVEEETQEEETESEEKEAGGGDKKPRKSKRKSVIAAPKLAAKPGERRRTIRKTKTDAELKGDTKKKGAKTKGTKEAESKDEEDKDEGDKDETAKGGKTKSDKAKGDKTKGDKGKDTKGKGDKGKDDKTKDNKAKSDKAKDNKTKGEKDKDNKTKDDKSKDDKTKDDKSKDDKAKDDKSKDDKAKDDKTKDDKSKDDKSKSDKTKDGKTKGGKTKGVKTKNDKAKGDKSKDDKTKSDKTKDDKTKDDKSKDDKAKRKKTKDAKVKFDKAKADKAKGDEATDDEAADDEDKAEEEEAKAEEEEAKGDEIQKEEIRLDVDGKASTILFVTLDDLVEHITENVRPNKRLETYKLYPVDLTQRTDLKVHMNPVEKSAGNWHEFVEIDQERWILRATINMFSLSFPACNRGKQHGSMCVTACVFARLYGLSKFKPRTVDDMIRYGDRLHTVVRKEREAQVLQDNKELDLLEDEIKKMVSQLEIRATETAKKFYIAEKLVYIDVQGGAVKGDLTVDENTDDSKGTKIVEIMPAKPATAPVKPIRDLKAPKKDDKDAKAPIVIPDAEETVLSLRQGLKKYFDEHNFGVLNAKRIAVGVWKLADYYYMFDPDERGPGGVKETNGMGCITRFKNLDHLADVFRKNLNKDGSNTFTIDKVTVQSKEDKKPQPEVGKVIPTDPKITAFHEITPGKLILRGNFHQDNPKFGLQQNAACMTHPLVAIAMSQIHRTETWTKPIIDEILTNGFCLYKDSVNELGFKFNSWENKLTLDLVNSEFNIGVMKVCVSYNFNGLKQGILNIKDPKNKNLRRGLDEFFYEYQRGIVQSSKLTTAVWTDKNLFYMFDPNPRGQTGLFQSAGTACLMVFNTLKLLADHFLQNVPEYLHCCEYTLIPVEVTVTETKPFKKTPVKKTDILNVTEIDSLASNESVMKETSNADVTKKGTRKHTMKCKLPKDKKKELCCCPTKNKVTPKKNITGPTKTISAETKKHMLRDKMDSKREKEVQLCLQRMRKEFCELQNGDAILRAHYSQNSENYSAQSRNKQSIPNALVAIVMFKLHEPTTWTYKNIEIILDSADVLYKDSYTQYRPVNPFLGLKNCLRNFHILHYKIKTTIYKPAIYGEMKFEDLYVGLLNFFMQETAGILCSEYLAVAVFQKAGQYYMFDPHDRNAEGLCTNVDGAACLLRFANVENLVAKYLTNSGIDSEAEDVTKFSISAVIVESIAMDIK